MKMATKNYLDRPLDELTREGIEEEIRVKFGSLAQFLFAVKWSYNKFNRLFNGYIKYKQSGKPDAGERLRELVDLIKKTRKPRVVSTGLTDADRAIISKAVEDSGKNLTAIEEENGLPKEFIYNVLSKRIVRSPFLNKLYKGLNIKI